MTFRTAKSLLSPLDTLFFDEVADIWFLTIKGAVTALKGGTKNA